MPSVERRSEPETRRLTESDLPAVVGVHLEAFPKSALSELGPAGVQRDYRWLLAGPHDCLALGAFSEQRLLGFCFAGVFQGALSGFLRHNLRFLVWRVVTHPWLLTGRLFGGAWRLRSGSSCGDGEHVERQPLRGP